MFLGGRNAGYVTTSTTGHVTLSDGGKGVTGC